MLLVRRPHALDGLRSLKSRFNCTSHTSLPLRHPTKHLSKSNQDTFSTRSHQTSTRPPPPTHLYLRHASTTSILPSRPPPATHLKARHSSTTTTTTTPPPQSISTTPPQLPPPTPLQPYRPPSTGFISYLPKALIPYAELSRLDKPAGTYYLLAPCLFSTLLFAPLTLTSPLISAIPPSQLLYTAALFTAGALIMRGAGCTINDLWDRNLDPHVTRTRLRPIARGAVSVPAALVWTGLQLSAGLAILLQFPPACFFYATPSLLLVAVYPLAKRITHYPQFILGLTFSWGAWMGPPALGLDMLDPANGHVAAAAGLLYSSCVAWTVLYDMIYAHQDIKDDARVGIKSIALRHEANTKSILSGLAVVQVALLAGAGAAVGAGPAFLVGSCGAAAVTLGLMIKRVNLKSVEDCWWWFRNGCWFTGGAIVSGMLAEYVVVGAGVW